MLGGHTPTKFRKWTQTYPMMNLRNRTTTHKFQYIHLIQLVIAHTNNHIHSTLRTSVNHIHYSSIIHSYQKYLQIKLLNLF
jgi:hypothetical protein